MRNGLRGPPLRSVELAQRHGHEFRKLYHILYGALWRLRRKGAKTCVDRQALEKCFPLCYFYILPITNQKIIICTAKGRKWRPWKNRHWPKATCHSCYPRSSESVSSTMTHPQGIARHKDCLLGGYPPQILAQKMLASDNNLHTCATLGMEIRDIDSKRE